MGRYIVRIDSATKPKQKPFKVGPSSAAWITWLNERIIASGIIYFDYNGPNKAFYDGIIAALTQLERGHFHPAGTDEVKVYGDCRPVIDQLNNKRRVIRMKKHFKCIQDFTKKHSNVTFEFIYQNETNPEYKKVDILSREGRSWIEKMINKNF